MCWRSLRDSIEHYSLCSRAPYYTSFKGVDYTPNPNASDSENYLGLLDDNEHLEKVFDTYNENLKWVNQNITDSLLLPGYVGSDNQVVDVLGQFQLDQATKVINDLISSNKAEMLKFEEGYINQQSLTKVP